jgi:hypothetical protein
VAEPSELFRLKCANDRYTADINALQTEQSFGLSGLRPIQPQFNWIEAGLPRTYTKQARWGLSFIKIVPSLVTLLTLCGRRNKQSQFPRETDDFESSFNLARVNLTHTLGTSKDRSEATVSLIFRVMDQGHHKRLQDRTHTICAGYTSVARLHDPVFLSAMQNVLPHVGACKHKIKVEWWRYVHLPGHSGTRLTALPDFTACG